MDSDEQKIAEKEPYKLDAPPQVKPKSKGLVRSGVAAVTRSLRGRSNLPATRETASVPAVFVEPERRFNPYLWSFVFFVLLPTIAGAFYFLHIASDQYQSEARLSVRAIEPEYSEKAAETEATTAAPSTTFATTSPMQDAYILTSYIRSRAVIDDIGSDPDIRQIFQRPEADFLARLDSNASIDALTIYWQRMVDAFVDPLSGAVTLEVTAFRPDDALKLNQAILKQSEKLLNQITEKSRADATRSAELEVNQAFTALQASLKALQDFRNKDATIDPTQSASRIVTLLLPLMTDSLKAKNDEAVMSSELSADAPSLKALRQRIAVLDSQIAGLKSQLTGNDSQAVANSLARFEELDITRLLNERKYSRAQSALDRAEVRARRQAVYLSVFVPPTSPEYAKFPSRFVSILMLFAALLLLWSIGATLYASLEDHRI